MREASPTCLRSTARVGADERTPWLELKGDRFIREIAFVYPAQSRRSKARLEIWGEYDDSWFQPGSGSGAFATANNGWLYLGGQSRSLSASGAAWVLKPTSYRLQRNRGFRSLRLDVKNRAITLNRIAVIYADESSDVFGERQRVAGGSSFGPVELKPDARSSRSRSATARASSTRRLKAVAMPFVEFWAK